MDSGIENTPAMPAGSSPSSSWSDLPEDLLLCILQRLQLPEAIAFASVCTSWRSAATHSFAPVIMSWRDILESRTAQGAKGSSFVNCKFLHLLDVNKAYDVRFPQGLHFVTCCGSSHGWLILVNKLANLVLYNPLTSEMIPLPPITDFPCVEAVEGNAEAYRFEKWRRYDDAKSLATWFYQKAILSCSPSKTANYVVMIIHRDNNWLSFVRAGDSKWTVAATLPAVVDKADRYADCAYHNGMFYSVTFQGIMERWDLDAPNGPAKEVILARRSSRDRILARHMVSTPWGDLLEVRAYASRKMRTYKDGVVFLVSKVDVDGCEKPSPVPKMDLMEHAIFIGLNHSACLPTKNFPGLRPRCIYFSVPWLAPICYLLRPCPNWEGVRIYDLEQRTFETVFPLCSRKYRLSLDEPYAVWITPNL